jgi:phage shock protein B
MQAVFILATIFGGIILALTIIGSTILMAMKIRKDRVSRKGPQMETNEARMIQEIHQGLSKMEKRVESLETIILEHERKGRTS